MAQTIQIVPKYSFPYVETVVNDYTAITNAEQTDVVSDTVVRYIFPFVSSKGVDNTFIRKRTRSSIVSAYGDTNYKKYGQPLMQALSVAEASNTEVWCMRVMPDDANYANNVISAYFKADSATDVPTASNRKFRIKYVQKPVSGVLSVESLLTEAAKPDGALTGGVYLDTDGYTQVPGLVTLYSAGRGKYGNNYRIRMSQDLYYEKDYGIKYYDFEVISTESGLNKEATYVGAMSASTKYENATLITDILADVDDGVVPVFVHVDEDGFEDLYNQYVLWLENLVPDLESELAATETALASATGTEKTRLTELKTKIVNLITEASNVPELDTFDAIFGRNVASSTINPFMAFPVKRTADTSKKAKGDSISVTENGVTTSVVLDTEESVYLYNESYTDSNVVAWDSVTGAQLSNGSDGSFDPAVATTSGKTVDEVVTDCYIKAFSGVYDKRVLTAKRIKASALWDANYHLSVKNTMADLALVRNDAICYLDSGIMSTFNDTTIKQLINDYAVFDDYKISKNVHHYYVKESTTKKRVPVTITYFLARQYADHVMNYGSYIPFVKSYAQLTGHIKDSLAPSVEDYETDLKELLTTNRFNFFETIDDNVYQRATQNTSQMTSSDLLEENNVATLYEMKRIVEMDINDRLYNFSDAEARQRFRNYEKAKFADWSGREVESFDIDFRMNAWESERSVLHAYIDVTFRGLQKRAILEIDVNKRSVSETDVV